MVRRYRRSRAGSGASAAPINRSKSERSTFGQFGIDTVGYRFRPVGEEFWAGLLSQPHRAIGGAAVLSEKPAGIVVSVHPGIVRVPKVH